ncbi:hypothetical protein PAXINDRAFT_169600 [Paxillus involutus ATCC 200175]|uniref:Uncharacterized protein n=1 Tax=Paxillus involutus ATCC 200175 TaxID=664439 RepID=A0A0C9TWS8_PAXIN|nr:hypothetical protein PAXINDRAFT_169600 [Paxillus involutus ATCC 200175]
MDNLNTDRPRPALTKWRSAADLGRPSTSGLSRSGFEPGSLMNLHPRSGEQGPSDGAELSLPDPPPFLTRCQRRRIAAATSQWKLQASKSWVTTNTLAHSRVCVPSLSLKSTYAIVKSQVARVKVTLNSLLRIRYLAAKASCPWYTSQNRVARHPIPTRTPTVHPLSDVSLSHLLDDF